MVKIKEINNDADLAAAVARIDELFKAYPNILEAGLGNPEYDELNALSDLVIDYEDEHYPIEPPTPAGAIEFWMDQSNLSADDLLPCIGSREMVDEVLAGQREVTPEMAEALYEKLNIDVRDLLGKTLSRADNP